MAEDDDDSLRLLGEFTRAMHGSKRERAERLRIATAAVERMRQETNASPSEIAATLQLVVDQLHKGLDPNEERMLLEVAQALKDAGAPLDDEVLALLDPGSCNDETAPQAAHRGP